MTISEGAGSDYGRLTDEELVGLAVRSMGSRESDAARVVLEHRRYLQGKRLNVLLMWIAIASAVSTAVQAVAAFGGKP